MEPLKKLKYLFFLNIMLLISACDSEEVGNWEPMKWEYKNVSDGIKIIKPSGNDKDHAKYIAEIKVTKSGSLDIVCKNYNGFWFQEYPDMTYEGDFRTQFSSEYCAMKIEGNVMHCEFFDIEGQKSEEFQIVVTAGDIFFKFNIDIN